MEEINSRDFNRQAAKALYPSILDPVVFTFWGMVLGRLFPVTSAKAFCASLRETLKCEVGVVVSANWLMSRISTVYWQSRLYAVLLRRIKSRVVLVSDTGEYALCLACKRLGVRFIELQHGAFDASHPDAVPEWANGSDAELLIPDVLACRGEFWKQRLSGTRQGENVAVAVGSELIDEAREKRRLRRKTPVSKMVLTSQGLDTRELVNWVEMMVIKAPSGLDWSLTIKLHPVYDAGNSAFDHLGQDARISIVRGADQPNIFDLLAEADLHLSIASACHFDAVAIGVPTVVIPLAGFDIMKESINSREFYMLELPADVWGLLGAKCDWNDMAVYYSKPGFVQNLLSLL